MNDSSEPVILKRKENVKKKKKCRFRLLADIIKPSSFIPVNKWPFSQSDQFLINKMIYSPSLYFMLHLEKFLILKVTSVENQVSY